MEEKITINGTEYIRSDLAQTPAPAIDGMPYVMCRTYSAGVFAGYLEKQSEDGKRVTLRKARRIWYWKGAASLSQLATEGTREPKECKFPCEVDSVELMECIELIPITAKAKESIESVPVWKM